MVCGTLSFLSSVFKSVVRKLCMHSSIDLAELTFLCHLESKEGLNITVCIIKSHSFMQISTVIINLNLVSKVKGGKFSKCTCASHTV